MSILADCLFYLCSGLVLMFVAHFMKEWERRSLDALEDYPKLVYMGDISISQPVFPPGERCIKVNIAADDRATAKLSDIGDAL